MTRHPSLPQSDLHVVVGLSELQKLAYVGWSGPRLCVVHGRLYGCGVRALTFDYDIGGVCILMDDPVQLGQVSDPPTYASHEIHLP